MLFLCRGKNQFEFVSVTVTHSAAAGKVPFGKLDGFLPLQSSVYPSPSGECGTHCFLRGGKTI